MSARVRQVRGRSTRVSMCVGQASKQEVISQVSPRVHLPAIPPHGDGGSATTARRRRVARRRRRASTLDMCMLARLWAGGRGRKYYIVVWPIQALPQCSPILPSDVYDSLSQYRAPHCMVVGPHLDCEQHIHTSPPTGESTRIRGSSDGAYLAYDPSVRQATHRDSSPCMAAPRAA